MQITTSFKVACGYIVLIATMLCAIYYIYGLSLSHSSSTKNEQHLLTQRENTDNLVSELFQAEYLGQIAALGDKRSYDLYSTEIDSVLAFATNLRNTIDNESLKLRLDTLITFIHSKRNNVKALSEIIRNNNYTSEYYSQIQELIQANDSLTNTYQVIHHFINTETEYTVNNSDKNLFKRIGDVFSPNKNDTVNISHNSHVVKSDTITQIHEIGDSISHRLSDINQNAQQLHAIRLKEISTTIEMLRCAGAEISKKISQLTLTIREEEHANVRQRINAEIEIREKASTSNAVIAIIAIILASFFMILIWRDISKANSYRKQLEDAKNNAESLLRLRENLMLTITHDIKAPIGSILGYIDLLKCEGDTTLHNDYLDNINTSGKHLLKLVNSLLDYHRLEVGKLDLTNSCFSPQKLISESVSSFKPISEKKRLKLLYTHNSQEVTAYSGDAFRIRQIIDNLISNAIKFTDEGEVEIASEVNNDTLYVAIRDTGRGMSAEEQEAAFKEFTRLDNAAGKEGVGLGLSITAKLIALLGGTIDIDSSPGNGSTFYLSIPLTPSNDGITISSQPIDINYKRHSQPFKILVIDDDSLQLQLTKAMLLRVSEHADITTCNNSGEALKIINKHRFDIIFTDIQMPDIDGMDLAKQILCHTPDTPIIAMTARSDMEIDYFKNAGFISVIHKPYNIDDLSNAIALIEQSEQLDLSALTAFADGDNDAEQEILDTLLNETISTRELFQKAGSIKDKAEVCRLAHKILPIMTSINANAIDEMKHLNNLRNNCNWEINDNITVNKIIASLDKVIVTLKRLKKE